MVDTNTAATGAAPAAPAANPGGTPGRQELLAQGALLTPGIDPTQGATAAQAQLTATLEQAAERQADDVNRALQPAATLAHLLNQRSPQVELSVIHQGGALMLALTSAGKVYAAPLSDSAVKWAEDLLRQCLEQDKFVEQIIDRKALDKPQPGVVLSRIPTGQRSAVARLIQESRTERTQKLTFGPHASVLRRGLSLSAELHSEITLRGGTTLVALVLLLPSMWGSMEIVTFVHQGLDQIPLRSPVWIAVWMATWLALTSVPTLLNHQGARLLRRRLGHQWRREAFARQYQLATIPGLSERWRSEWTVTAIESTWEAKHPFALTLHQHQTLTNWHQKLNAAAPVIQNPSVTAPHSTQVQETLEQVIQRRSEALEHLLGGVSELARSLHADGRLRALDVEFHPQAEGEQLWLSVSDGNTAARLPLSRSGELGRVLKDLRDNAAAPLDPARLTELFGVQSPASSKATPSASLLSERLRPQIQLLLRQTLRRHRQTLTVRPALSGRDQWTRTFALAMQAVAQRYTLSFPWQVPVLLITLVIGIFFSLLTEDPQSTDLVTSLKGLTKFVAPSLLALVLSPVIGQWYTRRGQPTLDQRYAVTQTELPDIQALGTPALRAPWALESDEDLTCHERTELDAQLRRLNAIPPLDPAITVPALESTAPQMHAVSREFQTAAQRTAGLRVAARQQASLTPTSALEPEH